MGFHLWIRVVDRPSGSCSLSTGLARVTEVWKFPTPGVIGLSHVSLFQQGTDLQLQKGKKHLEIWILSTEKGEINKKKPQIQLCIKNAWLVKQAYGFGSPIPFNWMLSDSSSRQEREQLLQLQQAPQPHPSLWTHPIARVLAQQQTAAGFQHLTLPVVWGQHVWLLRVNHEHIRMHSEV